MAISLPTFSKTIDNKFVQTWYEVRKEAIDNVLLATPIWAALKLAGCFATQVGGTNIERTIRYAVGPTPSAVAKGSLLPSGEIESRTAAFWTFRYLASHAQRTIFEDRENAGKFQIQNYVTQRLMEAQDALKQRYETDLFRAHVTDESGKEIQGLNDMIPVAASRATGAYGGITRASAFAADANGVEVPSTGNTFWGCKYLPWVAPKEINLLTNMTTLYNSLDQNQNEPPDLIVTDQANFELYEEFSRDSSQLIKDNNTKLADLGFTVLRFKGKPLVFTPNITAGHMLMLNTGHIEVIYDPTMWFQMGEWKWASADDPTRLAHIISCMNIFTQQPRRHGRLY